MSASAQTCRRELQRNLHCVFTRNSSGCFRGGRLTDFMFITVQGPCVTQWKNCSVTKIPFVCSSASRGHRPSLHFVFEIKCKKINLLRINSGNVCYQMWIFWEKTHFFFLIPHLRSLVLFLWFHSLDLVPVLWAACLFLEISQLMLNKFASWRNEVLSSPNNSLQVINNLSQSLLINPERNSWCLYYSTWGQIKYSTSHYGTAVGFATVDNWGKLNQKYWGWISVSVWVFSRYSDYFPQSKILHFQDYWRL